MTDDPFSPPPELRRPERRLRGRMVAPVTLWTAGQEEARTGLTVSSILVAEGDPSSVLGLVNDMSGLWDAVQATGAFVVHVLERRHRALAERFAGARPSPGGLFHGLDVAASRWGPCLADVGTRACCGLVGATEVGYQQLVRGVIERVEIGAVEDPLGFFRGRYRALAPRGAP
jgi:3-hydroxy-9,10-secoandrosta-1,3,5(10)-triene-9,17-dione monooxygenase reductase component